MPESVKRRGSSGPTMGATDRSCWSARSSVVAMWPRRLRADRDPDPHRLLGRLAVVDLDEGPRPDLDERALGGLRPHLDRREERRPRDIADELAGDAEVHPERLDPHVALLLRPLEAEPHARRASG